MEICWLGNGVKRMKNFRRLLLLLVLTLCGLMTAVDAEAKVKVKSVKVKSNYGKIVHVGKGKKVRVSVQVKVRPNRSSYKGVRYRSKNKRIAKINSIGQVKGMRLGKTRVYAISKKNKKKRASITVKVVKPLKKILFSENEKTIKTGESFQIKKRVIPSDTGFKKVVWSSSATSVAKVSSGGNVTAVAPGIARITAKAVDGSGTKAVCQVKVESPETVNITGVRALSRNTVRVTFDQPVVLDQSKFNLMGKTSDAADYNTNYEIKRIRNYGNQTYDLRIADRYSIEKNSHIRVTVNSLPGNGTKSFQAEVLFIRDGTPENVYVCGITDRYIKPVTFDLSDYGCGSLRYQIGSLPDGVSYKICGNKILFTGKANRSYFGKTTVISAVDELDNETTANIYWYIGSGDSVVGYADERTLVSGEEISEEKGKILHVMGGSGEYQYTFYGLPNGIQGSETTGALSGTALSTGNYHVKIEVQDKNDSSRKIVIPLKIQIENGFNISGTVYDSQGLPVQNMTVTFQSRTGNNTYTGKTDENGSYCLRVATGVYDGIASANAKDTVLDDIFELSVTADNRIDFYPECYRVNLSLDADGYSLKNEYWRSNIDEEACYEGQSAIYVLPGTYDIYREAFREDEETGKKKRYLIHAVFTVTNSSLQVEPQVSEVTEEEEDDQNEEAVDNVQ